MSASVIQSAQLAVGAVIKPNWDCIHTVLLDMDGTLLDLRFDNYFWQEFIPQRYGEARGLALPEAQRELAPRFAIHQGTLKWYCTDHWSRELGLNVAALKHEAREHIGFLPGALQFLTTARQMGRRLVLATNAHFDSYAVKSHHTGLEQHFDVVVSSHSFGMPKEHAEFWPALKQHLHAHGESFQREQTLFVDDSLSVLRAAREYGIAQVFAIAQPDTTRPARDISEFPAVNRIVELLP